MKAIVARRSLIGGEIAVPKEQLIRVVMKQTQGDAAAVGWKFRPLVGRSVDD